MHIADRSAGVGKRAQRGMEDGHHGDSLLRLEAGWMAGLVAWYMWVATTAVVAVVHRRPPLGERKARKAGDGGTSCNFSEPILGSSGHGEISSGKDTLWYVSLNR